MPSGFSASCFGFGGGDMYLDCMVSCIQPHLSRGGLFEQSAVSTAISLTLDIEVQVIHLGSHNIATSRRCLIGTVLLVRGRKWRVDRARGNGRSLHGAKRVGGRSGGALVGWMFVARYLHELQKVNQR
jgi:hypothetical protein